MICRTPFTLVTLASVIGCIATSAIADAAVHQAKDRAKLLAHWRAAHSYVNHNGITHYVINWGSLPECRGPWTFCWGYHVEPVVPIVRYPGYLYAPGKGIIDEACNLPTSACPNEQRDVNY
jgi:hypothetical protein